MKHFKTARVILMAVLVLVLVAGTVIERYRGADYVAAHYYGSWWFAALLALVAVAALVAVVQGRMWRSPGLLMVHTAVALIVLGAALSTWTGQSGTMVLTPNVPNRTVSTDGGRQWQLPFSLTMSRFEVVPYAGTHTPMDFVSHVRVENEDFDISMNHILRHKGYRFYQADYDDEGRSTLSVAHDPWGIAVVYAGFAVFAAGFVWLMADRRGRFRRLLRGAAVLLMLALPAVGQAAPVPPTLPRQSADRLGRLYMLYKGRVCPVQTYAKDFTTKLTGQATYRGLTPEQVLSGWLFYADQWRDEPMIKIKGGPWRDSLGLDSRRVSFNQLAVIEGAPLGPSAHKNLRAAAERQSLIRSLLSGKGLKIFPLLDDDGTLGWYAQNDRLPMTLADDEYIFVRKQLAYCQELVVRADYAALDTVLAKTLTYQRTKAGAMLPGPGRTGAERLYNALTTGRWLPMAAIALGLLAFACTIAPRAQRRQPRWLRRATVALVAVLTAFLLLIMLLRWVAGGHAPMAGGFDSMNLMAIAIGIITLVLAGRTPLAAPSGLLTMGCCLLVAMMSGANPPVTNLMPVLNSPLLTLHVAVIMVAYALFFFIMAGGVAGLLLGADPVAAERQRRLGTAMLYPAVLLLALGIIIGAVWANISWGSYWSWDPKEVWALITLIVYALPLHRGLELSTRGFNLYTVVAFLSVVVTYFGVNLFLGGMHSYN